MPLGRFTVRNEYGLGVKELYKDGVECEDPKAVLDGVAVSGLVGLLRQLGDLSQFAAEVFHGLQEQVASTVSRSRKLVTRVQRVEASLPSLEKAILSQTAHIHFAYSPGSEWHPRIKQEQNHFTCDDLPHFIMDSYEECNEPPRLQLLDRFDTGGPGSCLKRYSDPTFFRRASTSSEARNREKTQRERKAHKIKRRRSRRHSEQFPNCVPIMNNRERVQISPRTGQVDPSLSHLGDQSDSFGSKYYIKPDKTNNKELSSTIDENMTDPSQTNDPNKQISVAGKGVQGSFADTSVPPCSDVTWDEKLEIMEHMGVNNETENVQNSPETNCYLHRQDMKSDGAESINHVDSLYENGSTTKSKADQLCTEANMNVKAINVNSFNHVEGLPEHGSSSGSDSHGKHPTTVLDWDMELIEKDSGIHDRQDLDESNFDLHERDLQDLDESNFDLHERERDHDLEELDDSNFDLHEQNFQDLDESNFDLHEQNFQDLDESNFDLHERDSVQMYPEPFPQVTRFYEGQNTSHEHDLVIAKRDSFPQVTRSSEGENSPKLITNGNIVSESLDSKLSIGDVQYMLEAIENDKWAIETIEAREELSKVENSHMSIAVDKFGSGLPDKAKLEAGTINEEYDGPVDTSPEEVNNVNLLEWPHQEDIDSETDNFVDALYTIDSESESEYETQTKKVDPSTSECKLPVNVSTARKAGVSDVSEQPDAPLSLPENSMSSHQSEAATSQEQDPQPCFSREQSLESPPSFFTVSEGIEVCVNTDEIRLQSDVSEPVESSSQNSHDDNTRDMPVGSTSSYPLDCWTNGTLFGLQPSKPTVTSMSNSDPMASGNGNGKGNGNECGSKVDGRGKTMSLSVANYDHVENLDSNSQEVGSLKPKSHDEMNINDASAFPGLGNGHITNTSEDRSSLLSLLGRNLLKNGLRRSGSLDCDDTNQPNYPQSNLNGKLESSVKSPPPSPPLELMKISFRPVDGFETSKLKLKYPEEGNDEHEITAVTFPSFQLVPGSTRLHHDMGLGSDSDDDTFCRSYPCVSEDSVGHLSDSDSEQWESGDSSESNDHAVYDGLSRISSAESSRLEDLTPQLPPLPPLQWCLSRPLPNEGEDKPEQGSDGPNQTFDSQLSKSAISHPNADDSAELPSRKRESDATVKQKKLGAEPKVHDQKQSSHPANGKTDDQGDFLHQIRTKSFNLKRTDTARSLYAPSLATSNKVTAILQKASAIRQAVGSDGEDDSCWSDT